MTTIALSSIRIDCGTQPRDAIDQATVDEYADTFGRLGRFPPIVVYFDGVAAWLADGFHRYHAARKAGVEVLEVDQRKGTLEMAKLYAAGANADHGLRRTAGDKRHAIEMVLATSEGQKWKQKRIAKHCGVSERYVREVVGENRKAHGIPHPSTGEAKRAAVAEVLASKPQASNREIAKAAGVDHKTVAVVRAQVLSAPKGPGVPLPTPPAPQPLSEGLGPSTDPEAPQPVAEAHPQIEAAVESIRRLALRLPPAGRRDLLARLRRMVMELPDGRVAGAPLPRTQAFGKEAER